MRNKIVCFIAFICIASIGWSSGGGWDPGTVYARKYGSIVTTGNIVPYVDETSYLGSATKQWLAAYVKNLIAETITTTGVDERIYGNTYPANLVDFNYNATKVQISPNLIVDNSIYLAASDGGATGGAGFYISQPDGGCSKCYVDNAGTTFACANIACPSGM